MEVERKRQLPPANLTAVQPHPEKTQPLLLPPDADAQVAVRLAIGDTLAHWQASAAGFLEPGGAPADRIECLHQLRVTLRRLRVACGPLARAARWHGEDLKPVRSGLRNLGQQLGEARDWDVFIEETLPALSSQLHEPSLSQALKEAAGVLQRSAHLRAKAALESGDSQHLLLQLGHCLASPGGDGRVSFRALLHRLDRLDQSLRKALPRLARLTPSRLHRLRIAAKKMRYLTEFMASRHDPAAIAHWLAWLRHAQTVLGAHNDRKTAMAHLQVICESAGTGHGKDCRALQKALRSQPLPKLQLPPLPHAYWRGKKSRDGNKKPVHRGPARLAL